MQIYCPPRIFMLKKPFKTYSPPPFLEPHLCPSPYCHPTPSVRQVLHKGRGWGLCLNMQTGGQLAEIFLWLTPQTNLKERAGLQRDHGSSSSTLFHMPWAEYAIAAWMQQPSLECFSPDAQASFHFLFMRLYQSGSSLQRPSSKVIDSILLFSEGMRGVLLRELWNHKYTFPTPQPHFSYLFPSLRTSTGGKNIKAKEHKTSSMVYPSNPVQRLYRCVCMEGCRSEARRAEVKKIRNSKVIRLQKITVWRSTELIPWFKSFVDSV